MIKLILAGVTGSILATILMSTVLVIRQPGCAFAGVPVTPQGWYRVAEWKGNPIWCHHE